MWSCRGPDGTKFANLTVHDPTRPFPQSHCFRSSVLLGTLVAYGASPLYEQNHSRKSNKSYCPILQSRTSRLCRGMSALMMQQQQPGRRQKPANGGALLCAVATHTEGRCVAVLSRLTLARACRVIGAGAGARRRRFRWGFTRALRSPRYYQQLARVVTVPALTPTRVQSHAIINHSPVSPGTWCGTAMSSPQTLWCAPNAAPLRGCAVLTDPRSRCQCNHPQRYRRL
jgi:hypothetical protein